MKSCLIVLASLVVGATISFGAGIQWSSVNGYLMNNDGVTPLAGGLNGTIGSFVQLNWVGANGMVDSAVASGTGVSVDDVVVDYAWVGAGAAGGEAGWFDGQQVYEGGNVVDGRNLYLRIWSRPASDYASGTVPAASVNYGNSATWTWTKTLPTFDTVDFTAAFNNIVASNLIAIPEPTTLAFIGLGLGAFIVRRRMKG